MAFVAFPPATMEFALIQKPCSTKHELSNNAIGSAVSRSKCLPLHDGSPS